MAMNGDGMVAPRSLTAWAMRRTASATSSTGRSDRSPPMGQATSHPTLLHGHLAAADLGQPVHRRRHVPVVDSHHHHVVGVMGMGRGERPALEAEPADEPHADPARLPMALHHGDLRQIAGGIGDGLTISATRLVGKRSGDDLPRPHPDHPNPAVRLDPEGAGLQAADPNAPSHPVGRDGRRREIVRRAVRRNHASALPDGRGAEIMEIRHGNEVRDVPGGHGAVLVQPVVPGRVEGSHDHRLLRRAAQGQRKR